MKRKAERDARDIAIINERAEYLNKETADALRYQIPLVPQVSRIAGLHAGTTHMSDDFDDPLPETFRDA